MEGGRPRPPLITNFDPDSDFDIDVPSNIQGIR